MEAKYYAAFLPLIEKAGSEQELRAILKDMTPNSINPPPDQPKRFFNYEFNKSMAYQEIVSVFKALNFDPRGKVYLELGPGYGETLKSVQDQGIKQVYFVDLDPIFYQFNILRPQVKGWKLNFIQNLQPSFFPEKIDFLFCKGSVNSDNGSFNEESLGLWLRNAIDLLQVRGVILICPHWAMLMTEIRKTVNIEEHFFHTVLIQNGFKPIKGIPFHNSEPHYPISYYFINR